jgi:hypothetical protein
VSAGNFVGRGGGQFAQGGFRGGDRGDYHRHRGFGRGVGFAAGLAAGSALGYGYGGYYDPYYYGGDDYAYNSSTTTAGTPVTSGTRATWYRAVPIPRIAPSVTGPTTPRPGRISATMVCGILAYKSKKRAA